jgi:single-stranded DNA-binding protein
MEKLERQDLNKIVLQGPIVRKFSNEVATNFTIKVPRLNMPNKAKEDDICYNYPEVSFYGNSLVDETYKEGDVVRVEGMIQTKRKRAKDTGRDYYDQQIVGLSIEEAKYELEVFGYKEGNPEDALNKVYLKGTISKIIIPAKGVLTINIRTFYNGRVNNIQTFLYERNVEKYIENFDVGDKICAVGRIQTPTKDTDEGRRYYRNIVLSSICKE